MVAEYLSWFYTSDITAVIGQGTCTFPMCAAASCPQPLKASTVRHAKACGCASESQQFVMLGRHVQEFFKAKLDAVAHHPWLAPADHKAQLVVRPSAARAVDMRRPSSH